MVQYYFFPVELFGLIYGIAGLVSLPIMMLNIPLHAWCMEHESFALMSYTVVTPGLLRFFGIFFIFPDCYDFSENNFFSVGFF